MKEEGFIEVEGDSVEEAIKKALRELKVPRKKAKIEVISEEAKGLLACLELPAKVRVTIFKGCKNT